MAAPMGLPSVATAIVGLVDAVEEDKTGFLVPPRDAVKLAEALELLIMRPDLRQMMGSAARRRVQEVFDARIINQRVVDEYFHLVSLYQDLKL
jgi:glycosyltransferase involved in cell wall biosynthesis